MQDGQHDNVPHLDLWMHDGVNRQPYHADAD